MALRMAQMLLIVARVVRGVVGGGDVYRCFDIVKLDDG